MIAIPRYIFINARWGRYEEQGQDRKADMNRQDRREEQKKLAIAGEKSSFEE